MTPAAVAVAALSLALPAVADACATCIASPYGDRTYNAAYLGLIVTPFVVALAVGAVITRSWWTGRRRAEAHSNERCEPAPLETP